MNQREQEYINKIHEVSGDVDVPKALEPEAIEDMLESRPKKSVWKKSYTAGIAAACCLLICGIAYGTLRTDKWAGTENISAAKEETDTKSDHTGLQTAESYEDIYGYLEEYIEQQKNYDLGVYTTETAEDSAWDMEMAAGSAASEMKTMDAAEESGASSDFSETNVRQEGVDEADVVKTDGRYLYTLRDNGRAVAIVDTAGGELRAVSEVELEKDYTIWEFYVNNGQLILTGEKYNDEIADQGWYLNASNTFAVTYDVTDPAKPKKMGEVTQSGAYSSSRMAGGCLYLFSQYYVDGANITAKDTEYYIPSVNGGLIPEDHIYLPCTKLANQYEVICSVDMEKPDEIKDSKAIFADGGELYVSSNNIYWYERQWSNDVYTTIRRISYKDGELEAEASGTVDGYIHDSFCIDEYKGYLRVITTEGDTNSVYVLDKKLEKTGSITGLAEDERVYSARLLGDTGYFVTYRETDPLFSVDFSDPKNPKIIGELKIPGFSEYLHFYGEDKLLGIGMDTEEDGFTTNGVKLSMFDISDSTDVKEVQKYVMENVYSADVMYDYKAALIDVGKNIIGFSAYNGDGESYYVFSYDENKGFECLMEEMVNGNGYQTARGVYIDATLYVVKGNIIEAYSMEDYQKVDDIIL
ncbi:MAG: beta-propeller domain-containing protein [Eubacteriales bacterium]|nr:beta-propeller domain-containing protein [Eubacteriales bacterium]